MDPGARCRQADEQLLVRCFDHLSAGKYDAALDLCADHLVWEMPYAPKALHAPFSRERFGKLLRSFPAVFSAGLTSRTCK